MAAADRVVVERAVVVVAERAVVVALILMLVAWRGRARHAPLAEPGSISAETRGFELLRNRWTFVVTHTHAFLACSSGDKRLGYV